MIPRAQNLDALSSVLGVERSALITDEPEGLADAPRAQASPETGHIGIEDLGGEVHLKIDQRVADQRVAWDVALKILEALKRKAE